MTSFLQEYPVAAQWRFAVVTSCFNSNITNALLEGAKEEFREAEIAEESLSFHKVPGAFELPFMCDRLAETNSFNAIIALGCIIRGETSHFDIIAQQCAKGIEEVSRIRKTPIIFGVLTTETLQQASYRSSTGPSPRTPFIKALTERCRRHSRKTFGFKTTPESNKGAEAVQAALAMAKTMEEMK